MIIRYIAILFLIFGSIINVYPQQIEISQNDIHLMLEIVEQEGSFKIIPTLHNNSKKDILISIYGIAENYFTVNEVTYLNFGALINSKQHPYLPLESNVTLVKINKNETYTFQTFIISKSDIGNKIRLGLDYVFEKDIKNKVKLNQGYYLIDASYYKKNMINTYCIFKFCY